MTNSWDTFLVLVVTETGTDERGYICGKLGENRWSLRQRAEEAGLIEPDEKNVLFQYIRR